MGLDFGNVKSFVESWAQPLTGLCDICFDPCFSTIGGFIDIRFLIWIIAFAILDVLRVKVRLEFLENVLDVSS